MDTKRSNLAIGALAITLVASCATVPTPVPVAMDDRSYVTGSRLPSRDAEGRVKSFSNKGDIQDAMQRATIIRSGPSGN